MGIFGSVADFASDAWDAATGKNKANGGKDVNPYATDPNAYNYGGYAGGAANAANMYGNTAGSYVGGSMGAFGQGYNEFGAADQDRNAAYQSRDQQQQALGMLASRAAGNNLISNKVTAQQQQQLAAGQVGAAASARGPAALAMAQQNAAANTAQGQAQLGAQGAISAAQEQQAAQNAYMSGASGMRGQDIGQMGATTGLGSALVGSGSAQGQLGLGYSGLQNNVQQSQLAANMNEQAQNSANYNASKGLNAQVGQGNAGGMQKTLFGLMGAGSSVAGGMAGGGGKAVGGAVHGQQPYLVGEKGPELVVPKKPGWVLTAQQTAALLGAPPTPQQTQAMGHLSRARAEGGPVQPTWGVQSPEQAQEALAAQEGQQWAAAQDARQEQEARDLVNYKYGQGATKTIADAQGNEVTMPIDQANAARLAGYDKARAIGSYDNVEQTPEEAADEKRLRYATGQGKKVEAKQQAQAEKTAQATTQEEKNAAAYAKGHKLGSALTTIGGAATGVANSIDPGTTIGGTYAAPQMIALPTYAPRAFGGPMMAGGDFMGTGSVSLANPDGANAGELGEQGVGGLVSGTIGHENSDIGGAFNPMGGGLGKGFLAGAREGGGPVKAEPEKERKDAAKEGAVTHAANRAIQTAAAFLMPFQSAQAPAVVESSAKAPAGVLAAQGDAEGAARAQQIQAAAPSAAHSVVAGLRDRVNRLVDAAPAAFRPAPAAAPAVAPAPAAYVPGAPRQLEVYVAPAVPSQAPAGSGPVVVADKAHPQVEPMYPQGRGGYPVPGDKAYGLEGTRAYGGPMLASRRKKKEAA